MTVSWECSPDPASDLAKQAAADARSLFTARIGETDDSQATWNSETAAAIEPFINRVGQLAADGDHLGAARYAGEWASTYLAASSFLTEQLLREAIWRAYVASGGDLADRAAGLKFLRDWTESITRDTFTVLISEGRTLA